MRTVGRDGVFRRTLIIAASTLLSRVVGFVRELLMVRYLGVGPMADAFLTALRLPYSLRKIFAEGALHAALVPSLVVITEERGRDAAARVITGVLFSIGFLVSTLALFVAIKAPFVVGLLVPGWSSNIQQVDETAQLLRILIPSLLWFSLVAICAGALQVAGKFVVASLGQVIQNCIMVAILAVALWYKLSIETVAVFTMLSTALVFIVHWVAYIRVYRVQLPTRETIADGIAIAKKFFPCIITLGALEVNIFIDQIFASYLPTGSVSLLYYTQAFVRLPLGVFIAAFATVLLPVLTRISVKNPRRLSFHLYEALKLVLWVTIPSVAAMMLLGYPAFSTLMRSEHFTLERAAQASRLLALFALGVPFFAANRILVAIYHARHDTVIPTIITLATTLCNTLGNLLLIKLLGIYGLVLATIIAECLKTALLLYGIRRLYHVGIPYDKLARFAGRVIAVCTLLALCAVSIAYSVYAYFALRGLAFLTTSWGLWLWCAPLCGVIALIYYFARYTARCRMFFLGD